jgi:YVTN family beta-propeller protein
VANEGGFQVTPIRTATNTKLKAITVGKLPSAIAITPGGKKAYVANSGSDTVTPIRTATNTARKAIKVGSRPSAIAIHPERQESLRRQLPLRHGDADPHCDQHCC